MTQPEEQESPCPVCEGTGLSEVDCTVCNGRHLVHGVVCWGCKGAGKQPCLSCQGTGSAEPPLTDEPVLPDMG